MSLIAPHGGKLVDREARGAERETLLRASVTLPSVTINARAEADLELIAIGALSPLEGFLGEADYLSVRDHLRLANGLVWSIPITLSATAEERAKLNVGYPAGASAIGNSGLPMSARAVLLWHALAHNLMRMRSLNIAFAG